MNIPTIKSYNEFCARRKLINKTNDLLIFRSKIPGDFYNNIKLSYKHTYNTITTTTTSLDENNIETTNTNVDLSTISHSVDINLDLLLTISIGESIGNVSFKLLANSPIEIVIVYDGVNFIYESNIVKMGSFIKTSDFILNIPKCQPQINDKIIIKTENINESFSASTINELITQINQNSKILYIRDTQTSGDTLVLSNTSLTSPNATTSILSGTFENNISEDLYEDFNLEGGVGLPYNISNIDTGPTPLIHINYSERDNDVVILAKIYKVVNQKYIDNND